MRWCVDPHARPRCELRRQVTTVPLLANLFLPSSLCLVGAVGYEYLQMADEPFSDTAESKTEEVPEGQALVSWHLSWHSSSRNSNIWRSPMRMECQWTSIKIGHDHPTILWGQRWTKRQDSGCPPEEKSRHVKFWPVQQAAKTAYVRRFQFARLFQGRTYQFERFSGAFSPTKKWPPTRVLWCVGGLAVVWFPMIPAITDHRMSSIFASAEVFWGGLFGMISVPIFTALTHCPAWSGMMLVLGLLGMSLAVWSEKSEKSGSVEFQHDFTKYVPRNSKYDLILRDCTFTYFYVFFPAHTQYHL